MKLPPLSDSIVRVGSGLLSVGFAAFGAYIAKKVYETSIQVLRERTDCPGIELLCMSIVVVNTARLSLNLARNALEFKAPERARPRLLQPMKEIVAFSVGEAELVRRSERLKEKQVTDELAQTFS